VDEYVGVFHRTAAEFLRKLSCRELRSADAGELQSTWLPPRAGAGCASKQKPQQRIRASKVS